MRRRTFLKAIAAMPVALRGEIGHASLARGEEQAIIVLSGLTPDLPGSVLRAAVSPLLKRGVEFVIALNHDLFRPGTEVRPNLIAEMCVAGSQGIDIIPFVPELAAAKPYFQGRLAHDARQNLQAFFAGAGATELLHRPYATIATGRSDQPVDAAGLRAAAFRTLLQLPEGAMTQATHLSDNGVLTRTGGLGLSYGEIWKEQPLAVPPAEGGTPAIIALWFSGFNNSEGWAGLSKLRVEGDSRRLAESVTAQANLRPGGRSARGDSSAGSLLAVVVTGLSKANRIHVSAFAAALEAEGVPVHTYNGNSTTAALPPEAIAVKVRAGALPARVPLDRHEEPGVAPSGVVRLGVVRRAESASAARLALGAGCDSVLIVPASALESGVNRSELATQILSSRRAEDLRAEGLDDFARLVSPSDPVIRFRQETDQLASATAPQLPGRHDPENLMEDARLAWQYIIRFGVPETGLCMVTAQVEGQDVSTYDQLAMWDVGSLLLGVRAAYRLGLIERAEFHARVRTILAHIPRRRIAGMWLPCNLVSARSGQPLGHDFNVSDVGRLLSAFALLRSEPGLGEPIAKTVASWDLAKTIRNNRLGEVVDGRVSEFYRSQGAHYAVRAFARFGMKAESPYPDRAGDSPSDWTMRLLYAVSDIGTLGPEPLLYEGLEMGFSRTSGYLADALYAAQYRTHQATGLPVCPSMSPIGRYPWFISEGLVVGAEGDRWELRPGDSARSNLPGQRMKCPELLSSKAAYLWAALHPHPYSKMLLQYVRKHGRIAGVGFASGIFVATDRATKGYSDLNTNAIVLAAIDYSLDRMRPSGGLPSCER